MSISGTFHVLGACLGVDTKQWLTDERSCRDTFIIVQGVHKSQMCREPEEYPRLEVSVRN